MTKNIEINNVMHGLNALESTPGSNDRVLLLKKYLEDPNFKKVVEYSLHQTKHFGVKNIPVIPSEGDSIFGGGVVIPSFDAIFNILDTFEKSRGITKDMKNTLGELVKDDPEAYEIVSRIVNKDLKCGCAAGLVNKAEPGLIKVMPYMRCSTSGDMTWPAVMEEKADGMFLYAFHYMADDGQESVEYKTRKGYTFHLENIQLDTEIMDRAIAVNQVYSGEMRILRDGKYLPRKEGNGILNRILKGSVDPADHVDVAYVIWDALPIVDFFLRRYNMEYVDRVVNSLIGCLTNGPYLLSCPEWAEVNSFEEAQAFADRIIKDGGEGGILKKKKGKWKDHTSPDQIKFKAERECELIITGRYPGKPGTKYEDYLGGITYESSCGLLKGRCGGGFSDDQRKNEETHGIVPGAIFTCRFNEVIKSKGDKPASLFLPRFIEIRMKEDKDTADDFVYITGLK